MQYYNCILTNERYFVFLKQKQKNKQKDQKRSLISDQKRSLISDLFWSFCLFGITKEINTKYLEKSTVCKLILSELKDSSFNTSTKSSNSQYDDKKTKISSVNVNKRFSEFKGMASGNVMLNIYCAQNRA